MRPVSVSESAATSSRTGMAAALRHGWGWESDIDALTVTNLPRRGSASSPLGGSTSC
ncbi:hypothetical protein GCM10009808_05990 [Microbacterium sediminicola]|uniref:Uncharacterized protein n=1 Tax=Microbacterium sediminicola TaxID=415210 RepID=A0ABP4TQ12_9MICO